MYLTALSTGHCTTKAGQRPVNDRPVLPLVSDRTGRRRWSDLIAMPAGSNSGTGSTYASPEDNRIRQLGGTLKRLAGDDIRLVQLPNAGATKAKYEGFMLLDEAGDIVRATALPYRVPKPSEAVFGLPRSFFLSGWHMVLSDSEMSLLLSILAHVGIASPWPPELTVQLTGATRIRFHGLSLDTYSAYKYLAACGILEVIPDNNRRSDGTFEGQREGMRPLPHQLRVIEKGFDKDALGVVTATLKGMGTAKPGA
ncbi:hypothetical protein SAMN05661080_01598 [Modestobacter sp. DSM 44400]|uniref:hypothetical protein n=1 Tax=Modestobacter sp. DSM 44400 TaxID=1550230 RepID=UPI000898F206|nr:hypothetical protein [Modestobacter sp. DSM 44400]SDX88550.1 hypothetical protein SAMN05661080_01598 [Modestobacter sp. DSM 44400]